MKGLWIITTLLLSGSTLGAQPNTKTGSFCDSSSRIARVESWANKALRLNSITLGDAGESTNPDRYLSPYTSLVSNISRMHTNAELVAIIQSSKCPLITGYAFIALTARSKDRDLITELLVKLAADSSSTLMLDWGCARTEVQLFDYLFAATTRPTCFAKGFVPLTREAIEKILEKRKPFFKNKDLMGNAITWRAYRTACLPK